MAVRATTIVPDEAYKSYKKLCVQVKNQASRKATQFASGADARDVLAMLEQMRGFREALISLVSLGAPLVAYARAQEDDDTYDLVGDYQTMLAAVNTLISEASTQLSAVDVISGVSDGVPTYQSFTPAQLSGVIANLQAVDATIV